MEQAIAQQLESEERSARASKDIVVELEVQYAVHRIARPTPDGQGREWDEVKLRSYNGKLGGPLLEARPGDTLYITLTNRLPPAPDMPPASNPNAPHGFNDTNLHFHGLHVSPAGNSDNVLLTVEPRQHFHYEVKIPPDHPAGTYWYHAHKHGSGALQLANGMAGPLIIRGDIDRLDPIRDAEERIFLFQQIPYTLIDDPYVPGAKANMVESYELFRPGVWQSLGRRFTINGEVEPTLQLRPGEVQRWRFIHAGIREGLKVRLVRREGDQEISIPQYQIAHDGITTGRIDPVDETELQSGYRADVLVRAADAAGRPLPPGTYWLVDAAAPATAASRTLARVVVSGRPVRMRLPRETDLAPLAPFEPLADDELTGEQQAVFDIDTTQTPPRYLINGKPFDPRDPPRKLMLGAVEEWTVTSKSFNHSFHIHVNPFQIKTADGRILWRDTLFVPAGQTFKLRTRYRRYIGSFVQHCHVVEHGDLGMMELLELVMPGAGSVPGGHH